MMSIFITVTDIILFSLIAVLIFVFVFFAVKEAFIEFRNKWARKILSSELSDYQKRVKECKNLCSRLHYAEGQEAVVCPMLLNKIISYLPDPNNISSVPYLPCVFEMNLGGRVVYFKIHLTADRTSPPDDSRGIVVRVYPTGQELRFTLEKMNRTQRINGVDAVVSGYFWDFRFSGILLVSDEAFKRMIEFAVCVNSSSTLLTGAVQ